MTVQEPPLIRWKRQAEEAKKRKQEAAEKEHANAWATSWTAARSVAQAKATMNKKMRVRDEAHKIPHDPKVTIRRARQVARDVLQQRRQQPKRPWR